MGERYQHTAQLDARVHMSTYARKPVMFERGQGTRLFDDDGREYLDFVSGIGTINIGHSHPAVVEAVREQVAKLTHVTNLYHVEHRSELAEEIAELAGGNARVFFCNSGTEATEGAIKLARKWAVGHKPPGARTIISALGSFHGRTLAALAATGQPGKQEPFRPLPEGFLHVPFNDLDALADAMDESVCAVLLEPVQGEGGVHPADDAYLKGVRRLCDERDVLLMFDEVQCGLYRTGVPFAYQRAGVVPDVMTLAKALGNGLPIGAVVGFGEAGDVFAPGDHGSTFAGGPVVCAAARATLDVMRTSGFAGSVTEKGTYLLEGLSALCAQHESVTAVRGAGLMVAIDLSREVAAELVASALDGGILLNNTSGRTVRFLPPLVCTKEEIDTVLAWLADWLGRGEIA